MPPFMPARTGFRWSGRGAARAERRAVRPPLRREVCVVMVQVLLVRGARLALRRLAVGQMAVGQMAVGTKIKCYLRAGRPRAARPRSAPMVITTSEIFQKSFDIFNISPDLLSQSNHENP